MTEQRRIRAAIANGAETQEVDVLIIGGGINGLGIFRDLALQGVRVLLVDKGDFCSGASAASSHMIHGGVRYLENGEFRLVRESVHERNGLLRIAPHYVKPLQTTIPIFSTFSGVFAAPTRFLLHRPGKRHVERGALLIEAGLTLYDAFSRDNGRLPRHRFRGRRRARRDLPALRPDVKYTATYFDASVHDPERLAMDVLKDGLAAGAHARAMNYAAVVGRSGDAVRIRDQEAGVDFEVTAKVIVNTSGPWTDLTNESLGSPSRLMGGTKGSHIVLDNEQLLEATGGREIFFEHSDGRIVLIYPLKGRVLVGTTDLEHDISRTPVCTDEEIEYFFKLVHHVFPSIPLQRDQIVYTFSGVRPLPKHDDMQAGFVSRDYRLVREQVGASTTFSLVGGKWTTFRALAQHVANEVLAVLARPRSVQTDGRPIGGGLDFPAGERDRQAWLTTHGGRAGRERASELLDRYGSRAQEVVRFVDAGEDAPLIAAPSYTAREIRFLARSEHVQHLSDVVLRRTSLAFTGAVSVALLRELAEVVGEELGWSATRRDDECSAAQATMLNLHRIRCLEDAVALAAEPSEPERTLTR